MIRTVAACILSQIVFVAAAAITFYVVHWAMSSGINLGPAFAEMISMALGGLVGVLVAVSACNRLLVKYSGVAVFYTFLALGTVSIAAAPFVAWLHARGDGLLMVSLLFNPHSAGQVLQFLIAIPLARIAFVTGDHQQISV